MVASLEESSGWFNYEQLHNFYSIAVRRLSHCHITQSELLIEFTREISHVFCKKTAPVYALFFERSYLCMTLRA